VQVSESVDIFTDLANFGLFTGSRTGEVTMGIFDSIDGREITLPNEPELRRFVANEYPNGRPALILEVQVKENGTAWWEPDLVVTVNLVDLEPPEGCFFVRRHGYEQYLDNLLATGLFEDLGVDIPAGFVEKYARVWRLKAPETKGKAN
jgi:hypothetical protein